MTSVNLRLEGPEKGIEADALAVAVRSWLNILTDIDIAVSSQPKGSLNWYIDGLTMGSVAIQLKAYSRLDDRDYGNDVVRESIRGLRVLETEGLTPPYLSAGGIKGAKGLLKLIGNKGVHGISLSNHNEHVELSARAAASIDQLTQVRRRSLGSVEGKLEMISVHTRPQFTVYLRTHKAVRCRFPDDMLEQVKADLGQRVIAAGEIHWNAKDEPVRIELDQLRRLRTRSELPTIDAISGSVPDFTGDMDAVTYIRSMRDE